jgi:hypothetical protein
MKFERETKIWLATMFKTKILAATGIGFNKSSFGRICRIGKIRDF